MYTTFKIAAVAALFLVVGIVLDPLRPPSQYGASDPSPSPVPSPIPLPEGDFEAGTTYFVDDAWGWGTPRLILTIPAPGWSANGGGITVGKGTFTATTNAVRIMMTNWNPGNLYADPCHWRTGGLVDPPVGPSVEDLATALVEQAGSTPTTVSDVTIDGYSGKKVELSWPDGLDVAACEIFDGDVRIYARWEESMFPGGHNFGNGQQNIVYILDVGGSRVVIDALHMPIATESDLAELQAVVDSIRFEPHAPSPAPSSSPAP